MLSKITLFALLFLYACQSSNSMPHTTNTHCNLIKKLAPKAYWECGSLTVPENHDAPNGKTIELAYIIIKAWKKDTNHYPLIYFSGGPGGRTLTANRIKSWLEHPVRTKRDIILFDQRGIGYSSALPNMGAEIFQSMAKNQTEAEELENMKKILTDCQAKCQAQQRNLAYYNSFQNARDVGALMQYLGYEKYNLYGVSYGTRLARIIQDLFPDRLHSVFHNSPAPLGGDFLIDRLESYSLALDRIFTHCVNTPNCQLQYPRLRNDYLTAIHHLQKNPLEVVVDGQPFFINAQDGIYLLRRLLYNKDALTEVPLLIKALQNKGGLMLKKIIQSETRFQNAINYSMLLSVERFEGYDAKNTITAIDKAYQIQPLLPFKLGFFDAFYEAGRTWHHAVLPDNEKVFQSSAVPSLITVNYFDPITPPKNGYLFQKTLPNSQLYILNQGGHGGSSACSKKLMIAFMDNPNGILDTSCLNIFR